MKKLWFTIYRFLAVPTIYAVFFIGSFFNKKIKQGYQGRKKLFSILKNTLKDKTKNRLLVHCASVGEWEQAVPLIEKIKTTNPDLFVIVSFFSPSGYHFLKKNLPVDLKIYFPIDSQKNMRKFFKIIQPKLWIISKFDIWPIAVKIANEMNIPIVNTAATLSLNSNRNKGIAKKINKLVFSKIDHYFPIASDDEKRFIEMGVKEENITCTGDTRYDRVVSRLKKLADQPELAIFKNNEGIKFIAGSIWPLDEAQLLPALVNLMKKHQNLKLILVPHELHESHLKDIEKIFVKNKIKTERYTDFEENNGTETRVAIINTIGILARLYKQSNIAYIGGSFGTDGIHNVMEPAVFEQPVVFGPNYANSAEAFELLKVKGAFSLKNSEELEYLIEKLIVDNEFLAQAGKNAGNLIQRKIGATDKIINKLKEKYDFIS